MHESTWTRSLTMRLFPSLGLAAALLLVGPGSLTAQSSVTAPPDRVDVTTTSEVVAAAAPLRRSSALSFAETRGGAPSIAATVTPDASATCAPSLEITRCADAATATLADEREREMRRAGSFRQNVALIVIGVAAIVIGDEVDDGAGTLITLGGVGLTLWGAYNLITGS